MKVSNKGIYALRALRLLALNHGGTPLSVNSLATKGDIPLKYLEQVMQLLKTRGIVVSERGKHGGYALRLPPEQVTLGDIIRAVDGPLAPIQCASRTAPRFGSKCPQPPSACWIRNVMLRVRDNISAVMDQETLAKIVAEAGES